MRLSTWLRRLRARLAAPTGLTVTADGADTLDLEWVNAATDATGTRIERAAAADGPWAVVDTAAAGETTFADTGLEAETEYFYRLRAMRGTRQGLPTAVGSGETEAA